MVARHRMPSRACESIPTETCEDALASKGLTNEVGR